MKITYYLFFIAQKIVELLPVRISMGLADIGGTVYYYTVKKKRDQAKRNIRRVLGPDATKRDVAKTARKMCRYYAKYWIEIFWIPSLDKEYILDRFHTEGKEYFETVLALGKGMIVVLPHYGSWEAGAVYLASQGKFSAVAEVLKPPELFKLFCDLRESIGIKIFPFDHKPKTRIKMIDFLKEGGMLALLADRDLRGTGVEVEFFGEKTTLPPGPAALAFKSGAPILCVSVIKNDDGTWTGRAGAPIYPDIEGDRRAVINQVMQQIAHELENLIREDPAQWHMLMPAWPSDPS